MNQSPDGLPVRQRLADEVAVLAQSLETCRAWAGRRSSNLSPRQRRACHGSGSVVPTGMRVGCHLPDHVTWRKESPMLRGLSTLNLFVEDLPAATRWYTEVLGVTAYFTS